MAGLWLCTNGCRCVDGGRTSPVTVLISGGGPRGQLHDSAPTRGHEALADNSSSSLPRSLARGGRGGGGRRRESSCLKHELDGQKPFCDRWRLHPDRAECFSLAEKLASEVLRIWIMKMRAKSSASSYRNPDCLRLSEHQKRHWQRDIVIFKSKLTPGAPASSLTARHRATAWIENTAHGFDWTATGIIRHFSSNSGDIICHFSFHSNRAKWMLPGAHRVMNLPAVADFRGWNHSEWFCFPGSTRFFLSFFLSFFKWHRFERRKPSWMHQGILMWTSKKLSQIRGSDRREGEVWNRGKLDRFVYFQSSPLSLVGISECDLNLFIIFEGISPLGPFE